MNEILKQSQSWDESFMRMVYLVADRSKDPRTKIGAVIVKNNRVVSTGYNGFPYNVNDYVDRYLDREIKYKFIVHAEDNAVLQASKFGIALEGSTLYTQGLPCCECMKSVIQGGIETIVIHQQWPNLSSKKWIESNDIATTMYKEAGINLRILDKTLNLVGMVDENKITV